MTSHTALVWLQTRPAEIKSRALSLMRTLLRSVANLHDQGIAHRDLKAENLLIDELILTLLGTGQRMPDGTFVDIVGTHAYSAPEVFRGAYAPYQGAAADVFSCGVLFFMFEVGHPPFVRASLDDWHYCALRQDPARFWRAHGASVDQEVKGLIEAMLGDPEHRPSVTTVLRDPCFT